MKIHFIYSCLKVGLKMTSIYIEEFEMFSIDNDLLKATFYQPKNREINRLILYFHGGGLIFGSRNDLPEEYIQLLTDNDTGILAVDYLLAPTSQLKDIIHSVHKIIDWFIAFREKENLNIPYYILGRSAGGFLTLHAGLYAKSLKDKPEGLILLYSYFNLNDASFSVPNRHYLEYPVANPVIIQGLMKQAEIKTQREEINFPLYLYARQTGRWMEMLTTDKEDLKMFSLTKEEIQNLPSLFIASATNDTDVPSRQSRQLANFHPDSKLIMIPATAHDFDRTSPEKGLEVYQEMVSWLKAHK